MAESNRFRDPISVLRNRVPNFWPSPRVKTRNKMESDLAHRLAAGLGLILLLVGTVGVWAAITPIAGAVVASGFVVVESNIKKVQHQTGGIVSAIVAKNGDRVEAGDIVLSLDETQVRANLGITVSQLTQLVGRKARLEAERDQADVMHISPEFLASSDEAAAIAEGEGRLFNIRQAAKNGQIAQSRERIGQF